MGCSPRLTVILGSAPVTVESVVLKKYLAPIEPPAHAVRAPVSAHAAGEAPLAPRRVVDVGVVGPLNGDVREVVQAQPAPKPERQVLGEVRPRVEAAPPRHVHHLSAAVVDTDGLLVQRVDPRVPRRRRRAHVSVLGAESVAGLREPVVVERRVLAAADGPEERVADRVPLEGRRGVHRQQEARRPVLLVDRVVDDRQVEDRHALHAHQRVLQHGVMVDVQHRRARRDLPARLRLHARGEAAVGDPVLPLADLLEDLPVEEDLRLLRAEGALLGRLLLRRILLQQGAAGRVAEGAELRLRVELERVGGDPLRRGRQRDVAAGAQQVAVREDLHLVGEELGDVLLDLDLDVPGEPPVRLTHEPDALLPRRVHAGEGLAARLRRVRAGGRRQDAQRQPEHDWGANTHTSRRLPCRAGASNRGGRPTRRRVPILRHAPRGRAARRREGRSTRPR